MIFLCFFILIIKVFKFFDFLLDKIINVYDFFFVIVLDFGWVFF